MMNQLKTHTSIVILSGLLLSACGSAATPAPTAAPAKPAAVATVAPAQPTAAPQVAAPTAAPQAAAPTAAPKPTEAAKPAAAGVVTLKLVAGESKAQYEVDEIFFNQNNKLATAIGITDNIEGEIKLDPANPSKTQVGKISVNIQVLKSDGHPNGNGSARRDNFIRTQWLESAKYPIAEFTPTKLEGLPSTYKAGDTLKFKMVGDMKVKTGTQPITWDVEAVYDGSTLKGSANTAFKMSIFNVEPPNIAGILKSNDDTKVKLTFVAKP
ncbi:MAG: YceI family protein [Anaerolineae bacterium]|nr:YceI family protein [Anaerolineae bacterium]